MRSRALFCLTLFTFLNMQAINYSINLMWINRKLNKEQKYLFPVSNQDDLLEKYLKTVYQWALKNPDSVVNLWYDSFMTTELALAHTEEVISSYVDSCGLKMAPIILRDVRSLPKVAKHPKVFSDQVPIFFRVDLLRVIAQVHDVTTNKTENFVYSDLDINAQTKEQMFDTKTISLLNKFGIVMIHHPLWLGFENMFSIVSNSNSKLFEAMDYALIDINITRAYNALNKKYYRAEHQPLIRPILKSGLGSESEIDLKLGSINLLSINACKIKNQKYIHRGSDEVDIHNHFFEPIFIWAKANPYSKINVWFDSKTVSEKAVLNTAKYIKKHSVCTNIYLKDVQDLPYVKNISAGSTASVVFSQSRASRSRIKMLEVIIAMHESEENDLAIFGDLMRITEYPELFSFNSFDLPSMFSKSDISILRDKGMLVRSSRGFTFGVVKGGNKEEFKENIINNWLNPYIDKAYQNLCGEHCCDNCCLSFDLKSLEQIIYCSYFGLFAYFYHISGFGELSVELFDSASQKNVVRKYEQETDGQDYFGLDRLKWTIKFKRFSSKLPKPDRSYIWIPTKKIPHPKPTLMYDDNDPVRYEQLS